MQWSAAVRNARLSALASTIGASAVLRLYGGTMPANCSTAVGANSAGNNPILVEFDLASTWMNAPAGGTASLANLPLQSSGNSVAGSGTNATFYRLYASDGVTCHEQGTITEAGAGGDLILDNTNIASGQSVQITAFSKTEPGA